MAADAIAKKVSIAEKLGGRENISAAVELFYSKVLADPVVNKFFEGLDMKRQRMMQTSFMIYAFGGGDSYKGRNMYEAHKNMGLTEEHFNAIAGHFIATLTELGVAQPVIDEAVAVVASTHDDVLGIGH